MRLHPSAPNNEFFTPTHACRKDTAIREQRPPSRGELRLSYEPDAGTAGLPLFEIAVKEAPDLSWLSPSEESYVAVHEATEGGLTTLAIDDRIPEATLQKLGRSLSPADRKSIARTLEIRRRQKQREHAPVRQGKRFEVPVLCRLVRVFSATVCACRACFE